MVKINILEMIGASSKVEDTQHCTESHQGYNPHHCHQNQESFWKGVLL
jgi:hypothetical protein